MNIEQLIGLDKELLLKLNGGESIFLDGFMWFATTTYIWIPTALVLVYILFKHNGWKRGVFTIIAIALVITAADQISSSIFKPLFHRWRPAQDPSFMYMVDIVRGYRGGRFGFISSHAANTFALTTFVYLLTRKKAILFTLLSWACLCSYSRIYLGVHYPGDIICGALVGILCAISIFYLYTKFCNRFFYLQASSAYSHKYDGYQSGDASVLYLTFMLTLVSITTLSLVLSDIF